MIRTETDIDEPPALLAEARLDKGPKPDCSEPWLERRIPPKSAVPPSGTSTEPLLLKT
ncbi:MAG: hypothetical protein R3C56_25395 [Pirellulaceae bacterium]